jgi:penicillin-binding protein 1C
MPAWLKRYKNIFSLAKLAALLFLLFLILNWIFPIRDKIHYSKIITDNRGEVIHAFLTPDQQWRMKTELSEISPLLRKTILAKEDKYFYYHPGVNPIAIGRAMIRNILHGKRSSGASTITMQVARALEPKRRTYWNKCVEMFRAFQLEWKYSKDEILQMYLNLAPYGGNLQGVKSASILYFRKNPDHLSLAEITALSIIPNRPSSMVLGRHNDLVIRERNKWLLEFAKEKVFTQKQIEDALREPLTATRGMAPALVPHLSNKLKDREGDIIRTYINLNDQRKIESLVQSYTQALYLKNIRNAAVVVIDNRDRTVISYIGSADFRDSADDGQVNGAAAVREPGSTLKPLLYGLCIDQGLITPKMMISDVAVNYDGYAPENYDRKFRGNVTMEYALEHSLNIPAVKSLKALGKDKMVAALALCDFRQVRKDQKKLGLSMILGGCGASLEELTGLYATLASGGVYLRPSFVRDDSGRKSVRVLSAAADFMIGETLSKINRPDFPLHWESTTHLPKIAWKTGTSYGRKDAWSIGYNKHYTVGIWIGNFSGPGIPDLSGANVATPLLFRIFNTLDYDNDGDWYQQPVDCKMRIVCSETGLPPADFCTNRITDYFIPMVSPAKKCDNQKEIMVSADGKISYCMSCAPPNGYRKKWYPVISPEMQQYFDEHQITYEKIPPHNPDCEKIFQEGAPLITSPSNQSEYLINKKDPEPLLLSCRTGNEVGKVYWYINDKFYKVAEAKAKQFFIPEEGPTKISCTDDKGRNRNIRISVKYVNL